MAAIEVVQAGEHELGIDRIREEFPDVVAVDRPAEDLLVAAPAASGDGHAVRRSLPLLRQALHVGGQRRADLRLEVGVHLLVERERRGQVGAAAAEAAVHAALTGDGRTLRDFHATGNALAAAEVAHVHLRHLDRLDLREHQRLEEISVLLLPGRPPELDRSRDAAVAETAETAAEAARHVARGIRRLEVLLPELQRVAQRALGQLGIVGLQHAGRSRQRGDGGHLPGRIAAVGRKRVAVVTRAGAYALLLVRRQRRIIDEAVGDRGGVAEMVILVHRGLDDALGHEADVLHLRVDVEHAVLALLDHVGNAVRTMNVDELRLLVDIGLVALRAEFLPKGSELLRQADHGAGLDIEVAGVKPGADRQVGDVLVALVFRIGLGTLAVAVHLLVARRRLQGVVHVGAAVPDAVALVHLHVVHLDRQPHVHRGIPGAGIDVLVDRERVGAGALVFNAIETRLADVGEVHAGVVVAVVVHAPLRHAGVLRQLAGAILGDAPDAGRRRERVALVKLQHGHLLLAGRVADLREADVGLADPVGIVRRLHRPLHHLAGLAGRQEGAQHEGAVLGEVAAVEEADLAVRVHRHAQVVVVRRQHELVALRKRLRDDEFPAAAVVEGREAEELRDLFADRAHVRVAGRIVRENQGSLKRH